MNSFDYLGLSSTFGLIATGFLMANLLLGVLLSTKYKWSMLWQRLPSPLKRVDIYTVHNWTAYIALAAAFVHPVLLLFDKSLGFSPLTIAVPFAGAPHQYVIYTLGAIAFYGLLAVVVTSTNVIRKAVTHNTWKWIHFASYAATLLFLIHGLLADPQLKDRPVDFLDAEKLLSEAGLVLLGASIFFRVRFHLRRRASATYYPLRVAKVIRETNAAKSYAFDTPANLRKQFRYTPGQFITLRLPDGDSFVKRSYTLSSSPDTDRSLQITIKGAPGGRIANLLLDTVKEGDELLVLPPEGSFFAQPTKRPKHYILIAGGSGITPMYSIIKSVLATRSQSRITLIYANRDEASIIFKETLGQLAAQYPERLRVVHVLTQPASDWTGGKGRLDRQTLDTLLDELLRDSAMSTEYYICGPVGFMDTVEGTLHERGVPDRAMHLERFTFSPRARAQERDGSPVQLLEVGDALGSPDEIPKKLKIKFKGVMRETDYKPNETVLDAAMRAGISAPHACQQGVCAACKATLERGRVRLHLHDALTQLEVDQRSIFTCQAVPLSKETVVNFDG